MLPRRDIDEADAIAYWCGGGHETHVAQAGGGDHVANCGYMTSSLAQGRGIARLMLEHSLVRAKARGFVDAFVMHKSLGADEDERSPGRGVGVGQG